MAEIVATVGERLKQALDARHMTAAELSRATGISRGSLSQYINDKFEPKHDRIRILADALRVSAVWLMGADVPMGHRLPASTDADTSKKIKDLRTTLQAQQTAINDLVMLVDDVEISLHPQLQKAMAEWAGKYAKLSKFNQQIINSTIDAMLKTQSTEDDASAKEKARPGTGELLEERYLNEEGG